MQLGSFLREIRATRRLTLEAVSRQAGVSRVTLNRWEKGTHQPRLPELEAALTALEATPRQRRDALNLLDAPRAKSLLREEIRQVAERRDLSPIPLGGDLLRTMRHRRRLSQEAVATQIGVSARTLHRWELSEVCPSVEQLHALCYALKAHEEEVVALTVGRFSANPPPPENRSIEGARVRLQEVQRLELNSSPAVEELGYLSLEAELWRTALSRPESQLLFADVCTRYAVLLHRLRRYQEAANYAERAIELYPDKAKGSANQVTAHALAILCPIQRQNRPVRKRELESLRYWLVRAKEWATVEAWMHSMIAVILHAQGANEEALQVNTMAVQAAERGRNPLVLYVRRCDQAVYLMNLGRAEEALDWLTWDEKTPPFYKVGTQIVATSCYLSLNRPSQAQDCLQQLVANIAAYDIELWRGAADALTKQLQA